jgi:glycosyltransferase involved in cell wall biosynthesis
MATKKVSTLCPDISIIVCSYNHAKWVERCLRSLLHQDFVRKEEYEVILIDDKSTDITQEFLKNFKFQNFRYFKNKKNIGLPQSINKAIKLSKGRYVVRVDSDDYVARNFLYLTKLFLNLNREYQAVAVDYYKVDDNEVFLSKNSCLDEQIACGIMFRKECLFDIGLYDPKFKMREGHEMRTRFEKKYKIGRLNLPLYKYRSHAFNRTKNIKLLKKYDRKLGK